MFSKNDIRSLEIEAISSLVRDLSMLSDHPRDLEAAIVADRRPLDPGLFRPLRIARKDGRRLTIGDIVAFRFKNEGAYPDIETHWGSTILIEIGKTYLGVLCERKSAKNLTAEFTGVPTLTSDLDLQFVCGAGGIGHAIGHSMTLQLKNGQGRASDVEILGVVADPATGATLNTIERLLQPKLSCGFKLRTPTILVGGSAADVGKTTTACAIIKSLARTQCCTGVKSTGTGRFGESNRYVQAGATYIVNQMFAGLPTTYVQDCLFLHAHRQMLMHAADPNTVSDEVRLPAHRGRDLPVPDVLVIELGGDIVEAGIPLMLEDPDLMEAVVAITLSCESGLALAGTIAELKERLAVTGAKPPVYAALPWGNVEGVHARFHPFVQRGDLAGLIDPGKPKLHNERDWRLNYAGHHRDILSTDEFADRLRPSLLNPIAQERDDVAA
jgi:hypothetical protein